MSIIQSFQNLPNEFIYIALSAVVAVIIWFEGTVLRSTNGKMPNSALFHVGSLIDTLWFFVSLACLYYLSFESIAMAVPIAYACYSVFGWIYGSSLMSKNGLPESAEDLVIPMPYVAYSQSFSLIFFSLCALVLVSPTLPFSIPFKLPF